MRLDSLLGFGGLGAASSARRVFVRRLSPEAYTQAARANFDSAVKWHWWPDPKGTRRYTGPDDPRLVDTILMVQAYAGLPTTGIVDAPTLHTLRAHREAETKLGTELKGNLFLRKIEKSKVPEAWRRGKFADNTYTLPTGGGDPDKAAIAKAVAQQSAVDDGRVVIDVQDGSGAGTRDTMGLTPAQVFGAANANRYSGLHDVWWTRKSGPGRYTDPGDPAVVRALVHLQKLFNLPVDGRMGPATAAVMKAHIEAGTTLGKNLAYDFDLAVNRIHDMVKKGYITQADAAAVSAANLKTTFADPNNAAIAKAVAWQEKQSGKTTAQQAAHRQEIADREERAKYEAAQAALAAQRAKDEAAQAAKAQSEQTKREFMTAIKAGREWLAGQVRKVPAGGRLSPAWVDAAVLVATAKVKTADRVELKKVLSAYYTGLAADYVRNQQRAAAAAARKVQKQAEAAAEIKRRLAATARQREAEMRVQQAKAAADQRALEGRYHNAQAEALRARLAQRDADAERATQEAAAAKAQLDAAKAQEAAAAQAANDAASQAQAASVAAAAADQAAATASTAAAQVEQGTVTPSDGAAAAVAAVSDVVPAADVKAAVQESAVDSARQAGSEAAAAVQAQGGDAADAEAAARGAVEVVAAVTDKATQAAGGSSRLSMWLLIGGGIYLLSRR